MSLVLCVQITYDLSTYYMDSVIVMTICIRYDGSFAILQIDIRTLSRYEINSDWVNHGLWHELRTQIAKWQWCSRWTWPNFPFISRTGTIRLTIQFGWLSGNAGPVSSGTAVQQRYPRLRFNHRWSPHNLIPTHFACVSPYTCSSPRTLQHGISFSQYVYFECIIR